MSDKNGGPAFPNESHLYTEQRMGMSLRDYFAAKAMQGQMEQFKFASSKEMRELASFAYEAADAMLAERAK